MLYVMVCFWYLVLVSLSIKEAIKWVGTGGQEPGRKGERGRRREGGSGFPDMVGTRKIKKNFATFHYILQ